MSNTTPLQAPILPVEFVADFFKECGSECLQRRLSQQPNTADKEALDKLFNAILWADDLARETADNNGLVSQATNAAAVDNLLSGWDAMRTLRYLQ